MSAVTFLFGEVCNIVNRLTGRENCQVELIQLQTEQDVVQSGRIVQVQLTQQELRLSSFELNRPSSCTQFPLYYQLN